MKEIWKRISFSKWYEVSNLGRVRNIKTKRIIKAQTSKSHKNAQVYIYLNRNFKIQLTLSHLVYNEHCLGDGEKATYWWFNGYEVRGNRIGYKDGDRTNICADNLYRY